jgi:integrase
MALHGVYTKNKKTAVIDLKQETAAELKTFLAGKMPHIRAFAVPDQPSKMIKKDLEAAGISYKTDEGTADFHSLRHSFITNLARSGVKPYEAMALARHSSITLTMNYYTHTVRESLRKIINEQPSRT